MILSLGTGDDPVGFPYEEIAKWGFIEWINPMKRLPLWSMMSAGQSESVNHMLSRIADARYFRLSGTLEGCSTAVDDASPANISALRLIADRIIRSHGPSTGFADADFVRMAANGGLQGFVFVDAEKAIWLTGA